MKCGILHHCVKVYLSRSDVQRTRNLHDCNSQQRVRKGDAASAPGTLQHPGSTPLAGLVVTFRPRRKRAAREPCATSYDGVRDASLAIRSRLEWLQEAAALEALRAEWQTGHAAAFCGLSIGALLRSDCPRGRCCGDRSITGRGRLVFKPDQVRAWCSKRAVAA